MNKVIMLILLAFSSTAQDLDVRSIIKVLRYVESDNGINLDHKGNEVGVLGVSPIMVREVNRILGAKRFSYEDRNSTMASYEMCKVFLEHQIKLHKASKGRAPTEYMLVSSWNTGSIFKPVRSKYVSRYIECKARK